MKKLLFVALCGLTALTFAGCGSTKNDTKTTAINTETGTTVVTNDTVVNTEQATTTTTPENTEQAEAETAVDSMYIKDGNVEFHNTTGKNWYADVELAGGVTAHFTQTGDEANLEIEGGNRDDYDYSFMESQNQVCIRNLKTGAFVDADLKEAK